MRPICRFFFLFVSVASLSVLAAYGQHSPSLGDAARQARQQKQKQSAKDSQGKEASSKTLAANDSTASSGGAKISAEQWKAQIQAQKSAISSLQSDVDKLNDSIHFAPGNCLANCVQWNERQKEKQAEVERMRAQLEDQKKRLENMQESARQQGYGSSVYDP